MAAAPRDQLSEDERRQLDSHRLRLARNRSRAVKAVDGPQGPSSGYQLSPSTQSTTGSALNTLSQIHLTSSPNFDVDQANGDNNLAAVKDSKRDNPVALETASIPKPHDSADEQDNHISGRIGHNATGHSRIRRSASGPRQTQLVTPNARARDQGQSTPLRVHSLFPTPDSPLVVHSRPRTHTRDQERHLRLAIGPVSVEAQLHTPSSGRDVGELVVGSRKLDETPSQEGHGPVLVVDLESVLFCVGVVTFLWLVWWIWSTQINP